MLIYAVVGKGWMSDTSFYDLKLHWYPEQYHDRKFIFSSIYIHTSYITFFVLNVLLSFAALDVSKSVPDVSKVQRTHKCVLNDSPTRRKADAINKGMNTGMNVSHGSVWMKTYVCLDYAFKNKY